jgi:hypothetical protein
MRNKLVLLLVVALSLLLSGCYLNAEASANQMFVKLDEGVVVAVEGPGGVYSEATCYFCDYKLVNIDTLTFSVEDPSVLTEDNQEVSVTITIQARRSSDPDDIKNLIQNWSTLVDDQVFINTITATAREGMKNGTRGYTLTEVLDDRNGLADAILAQLAQDAKNYNGQIINVTVENIGPSARYMEILGETANLKAEVDKAVRERDVINQRAQNAILEQEQRITVAAAQLEAEKAETAVQLEIARRDGELVSARNQVYSSNPQAFELEKLRLLREVLGENVIYFIPAGTDLTLYLLETSGGLTPIPAQ